MISSSRTVLSFSGRSPFVPISFRIALCLLLLSGTGSLRAQTSQSRDSHAGLDLAFSYVGERSLKAATGQNFWMQGGSVELGIDFFHGLGVAAEIAGTHTGSIGTSGVPLSLVSITCGPRYRWHAGRRNSLYGEAMIGEADGFQSLFPATSGSLTSSNNLAVQVGGGVDFQLSNRFALRVDAAWVRTQLPNATDNVQDTLRLGGGIAFHFGR